MKRNLVRIAALALVIVMAAGVLVWQRRSASASTSTMQTAKVTRGSVVESVSAAGNISAPTTASLAFSVSGRVRIVPVKVGDQVKKGQLLIQLDTTDLKLALQTAQAALASQQASFDATQTDLQFALRTAQANLASAQASYDAAKADNATNAEQIKNARATLDKVRVALDTAQNDYNAVASRPDVGMTSQSAALETAYQNYATALATYNETVAGVNDNALKTASASLDTAQVALEQAQKNMDTSLRTAQASLDSAKLAVDQAQRNLDNASLYAPFDGQVSTINYNANDTAGTGTAVTLVDMSNLQVGADIAEVDMTNLQVGQKASMTLDALQGKTYAAQVLSIGPVGTVTSGVVNYPVACKITNADANIKPGMTANLEIEIDRHDNVLIVPTKAVRTQGNQKIVNVLENGKSVAKPVSIGLTGDTTVEITKGLAEGEQVIVSQTQSK